jgi:hypothetical protein
MAEVDEFLEVASASLPRISELIAALPVEDRAGAFGVAERIRKRRGTLTVRKRKPSASTRGYTPLRIRRFHWGANETE